MPKEAVIGRFSTYPALGDRIDAAEIFPVSKSSALGVAVFEPPAPDATKAILADLPADWRERWWEKAD